MRNAGTENRRIIVVAHEHGATHPAVSAAADLEMGSEDILGRVTQSQINVPYNSRADLHLAEGSARRHRCDTIGELNLPNRLHCIRATRAVHRMRIDKHACADVVAAFEIGHELIEQIACTAMNRRSECTSGDAVLRVPRREYRLR